jgi:hypothetical protein
MALRFRAAGLRYGSQVLTALFDGGAGSPSQPASAACSDHDAQGWGCCWHTATGVMLSQQVSQGVVAEAGLTAAPVEMFPVMPISMQPTSASATDALARTQKAQRGWVVGAYRLMAADSVGHGGETVKWRACVLARVP